MILNYRRLVTSSLGLVGFYLFGFSTLVNAVEPSQTLGPQSAQSGEQRPAKPPKPRIDFAAAAAKLGVTEAKLKEALGIPARPPQEAKSPGSLANQPLNRQVTNGQGESKKPKQGRPQRPRLDIKGAAVKLGVSEQKLLQALGLPEKPPMQNPSGATQPTQ